MASSIKTGLVNLSQNTEAFFICLGDMPFVNKNIYTNLIDFKDKNEIIIPTFNGQQGNPILFSKNMKNKILAIQGDSGAKKIIETEKNKILNIETNNEDITKNYNSLDNFII